MEEHRINNNQDTIWCKMLFKANRAAGLSNSKYGFDRLGEFETLVAIIATNYRGFTGMYIEMLAKRISCVRVHIFPFPRTPSILSSESSCTVAHT